MKKLPVIALSLILLYGCQPTLPMQDLLVGTYTGEESKGIYQLSFDPEKGILVNKGLAAELSNPSYLAISDGRDYVYSFSSDHSGIVMSFQWDKALGKLNLLNQAPGGGAGPNYVGLSPAGDMMAVANYASGSVSFFPLEGDGSLSNKSFIYQHTGSGPDTSRQKSPHAHCAVFSPDGRFAYVADLGIDQIMSYPVTDGRVEEGHIAIRLDPGDGPRHLVFHPSKDYAFVVNELSATVVSMKVDPEKGLMERVSKASTLPEGFTQRNLCADIHVSADGRFLYASNRGHNSIAIFSVSEEVGLDLIATESTRGDWPRNFTLSPDEKYLLAANQNSGNIVVFRREEATGLLLYTGNELKLSQPVCLKF